MAYSWQRVLARAVVLLASLSAVFAADVDCNGISAAFQSDIDNTYGSAGCTRILGDLIISSDSAQCNVTSLAALSAVKAITGSFIVRDCGLADFSPLNSVISIGGSLRLETFPGTTLSGFAGLVNVSGDVGIARSLLTTVAANFAPVLKRIGGTLSIKTVSQLSTIAGFPLLEYVGAFSITEADVFGVIGGDASFPKLNKVGGAITIIDNKGVISINLKGLTDSCGDVVIERNSGLRSIVSLGSISWIQGRLSVSTNVLLTSIAGLASVTYVDGDVTFDADSSLGSLAAFNPDEIDGRLAIRLNTALYELAFDKIAYLGGLNIYSNDALYTLEGFNKVTDIGGDVSISTNAALYSLGGFNLVGTIEGSVTVANNPALRTLAGFTSLTAIDGALSLTGNAKLGSVNGFSKLSTVGAGLSISNNPFLDSINGLNGLKSIQPNPTTNIGVSITNNALLCDTGKIQWLVILTGYLEYSKNRASCAFTVGTTGANTGATQASDCDDNDRLIWVAAGLSVAIVVLVIVVVVLVVQVRKLGSRGGGGGGGGKGVQELELSSATYVR